MNYSSLLVSNYFIQNNDVGGWCMYFIKIDTFLNNYLFSKLPTSSNLFLELNFIKSISMLAKECNNLQPKLYFVIQFIKNRNLK